MEPDMIQRLPDQTEQTPPLLPAGTLVQLTADLIDEGKLKSEINLHIAEAARVLKERRDRGDSGGRCKITASIEIGDDKDLRDHVRLTWSVQTKTPKNERVSVAKSIGGTLLVQPDGSRSESPDQQRLFDAFGRPIGLLDPITGVITAAAESVGKIGRAAKA